MIFSYEELKKQKEAGINLSWKDITKEQLRKLYVEERISPFSISLLYGIKQSQVDYKRDKFGIKFKEIVADSFLKNVPESTNQSMKEVFISAFDIDTFSKIITHYAFRNGPVEDMHADGKLFEEDMMILNKFMVNRIAGVLQLIKDEEWLKLVGLMELYKCYGTGWDKAEPDTVELDNALKYIISK